MVGLSGTVAEDPYKGTIVGGYNCESFSSSRSPTQERKTQGETGIGVPNYQSTNIRAETIALRPYRGTFTVPVLINEQLTLNFVIDSGAADVSIPADVVLTLIRTGTLTSGDFLGRQIYRLADGSTVPSQTFRIKSLKVGSVVLENVTGSIASVEGSLLLGQSFLSRFKSWAIDNREHVLRLVE
jgi:predicted aspartyl protease